MAGKEKLEAQLAAVEALRQQPADAAVAALRTFLRQRNNYLVARAADLVAERRLAELTPELLTAFDRFFEDAKKQDPQCWAKNSLSRALAALELQEPDPFLRGMRHVQLEPVWGGLSDTAGVLRGTCALALVQCRGVPEVDLLRHLLDLLSDPEKSVRADAVRAIAQTESSTASLLLRLRALLGADEPEILGSCYAAVLQIEGPRALHWVSRFLAAEDDLAGEAALAIASTHTADAFTLLKDRWEKTQDPWLRSVLLSAMLLTRQSTAVDFLMALVEADSMHSEQAIETLLHASPTQEVLLRLKTLIAGNTRLERTFATNLR